MAEVKFVRLPWQMVTGNITDLDSGWHIGGHDVKPVPDPMGEPEAHNFVMSRVRSGHLQPAGQQEYDLIQGAREDLTKQHLDSLDEHEKLNRPGHQEAQIRAAGNKLRRELERLREVSPDEQYEDAGELTDDVAGHTQSIGGTEGPVDADVTKSGAKQPRQATVNKEVTS